MAEQERSGCVCSQVGVCSVCAAKRAGVHGRGDSFLCTWCARSSMQPCACVHNWACRPAAREGGGSDDDGEGEGDGGGRTSDGEGARDGGSKPPAGKSKRDIREERREELEAIRREKRAYGKTSTAGGHEVCA